MTAPRVPLVPSAALSEFGDLKEQAAFHDPQRQDNDYSYVPGFSEMRRQTAIELAEYQQGLRKKEDVSVLPVNLRWARNQSRGGIADNVKPFSHGRKGYRLATKTDIGQPWLEKMPGGAQLNADGTIRNGDTVLMVASTQDAAQNELGRRVATEQRVSGYRDSFANMVAEAKRANPSLNIKGLEPTVTKGS